MNNINSYNSLIFKIPNDYDGKDVKLFLRKKCGISSRMLSKLKNTDNGIMLNGKCVYVTQKIYTNDTIVLNLPAENNKIAPADLNINILFENESIIVFDKPAGVTVHPVRDYVDNTLANFAAAYACKSGENYLFRAVNRLDKDTSGCVICAKNAFIAESLKSNVQKTYYAVVEGKITKSGTVNAPIRLKENSFIVREVGTKGGKDAVTHYEPLISNGKHTLLKLKLETGRTHQIRTHMSYIGHPLAGDDLYGGKTDFISRQALHCGDAEILLPIHKSIVNVKSPFPDDIKKLILDIDKYIIL